MSSLALATTMEALGRLGKSAGRCLRSIGDNSTLGSIFLSEENYRILDRELKNNFATNIEELSVQETKTFEHTLKIEKKKKLKITKLLKEILAIQSQDLDKIKIDLSKFQPEEHKSLVGEGGIFLRKGEAGYRRAQARRELKENGNLTFYEIVELINRYTHLSCLDVEEVLKKNGLSRKDLVKKVNENVALLPFIISGILANAYQHQEKTETIEEEIKLAKMYPLKISVEQGKNILVVSREQMEKAHGKRRIGFHINPYNFDSKDEKDLLKYLRDVLHKDEAFIDLGNFNSEPIIFNKNLTEWLIEYNFYRPHQALNYKTPIQPAKVLPRSPLCTIS